ncbi:hypothetical protein [Paenibacillus swuensis]|uniref:hypothetical protein n=1 Tax=Paenibacillus swuensis TaxID=1178515 RepID=UPI0009EDB74D|nr:hypothetical protein [Paenibacillus swuensis]
MGHRKQQLSTYEHVFVEFSVQVEKWLKRVLFLFLTLLILSQGLLQVPSIRKLLSEVEQLEGEPYLPGTAEQIRLP